MDHNAARYGSIVEGIDAVLANDNLGFLMEGSHADQMVSKHCGQLVQIRRDLGSRHFALAFPLGSPYKDMISRQILTYNENGKLFKLRNKWFHPTCDSSQEPTLVQASRFSKTFDNSDFFGSLLHKQRNFKTIKSTQPFLTKLNNFQMGRSFCCW